MVIQITEPMDHILKQLQEEGRLESQGEWSMDLQAAGRKLAQFQLPDPYLYAARIVQAAVAAGARELSVELGRNRVRFEYQAPPLSAEQVGALPTALVREGASRECRHLGSALLALLSLEPTGVRVASYGNELSLGHPPAASAQCTSVTACFSKSWWLRPRPEARALDQRCCWSSLVLVRNGVIQNRYFSGGPHHTSSRPACIKSRFEMDGLIHLLADEARPGLLPGSSCTYGSGFVWAQEGEPPLVVQRGERQRPIRFAFPGRPLDIPGSTKIPWLSFDDGPAIACTVLAQLAPKSSFARLFQDGVMIEQVSMPNTMNMRIHAVADHLQTDLSGFRFIRDEAYDALIAKLVLLSGV